VVTEAAFVLPQSPGSFLAAGAPAPRRWRTCPSPLAPVLLALAHPPLAAGARAPRRWRTRPSPLAHLRSQRSLL